MSSSGNFIELYWGLVCSLLWAQCGERCPAHSDCIMIPSCLSWSVFWPPIPCVEPPLSPQPSPQCIVHPSSLLGRAHMVLPLHLLPSSSLSDQILPRQLYSRSMSSIMVSTGPHPTGFHNLYLAIMCYHRVLLSSFRLSWEMVFVLTEFGPRWAA